MQGFPVAPENSLPREDWDRPPWNRWSFQNIRKILPTAEVWRGEGPVWELSSKPLDLGAVEFTTVKKECSNISTWLDESYTDGFLLMHKGVVVYEKYFNNMTARSLHLSQSMAKSITSVVAGILVGKGILDTQQEIAHYLPELKNTAWKDAALQHVLDMTTGVRYTEDYEVLDSDIAMTDIASGWKSPRPGVNAPACIWDQILGLIETARPHGELFQYRSIETDVLAHCMERVTRTRLSDLVSKELWQPLGCEQSACFTVDAAGYALADGGFNASLRDYARFGQMLLQNGFANGCQIVPPEWVEEIPNGDADLFGEPYTEAAPNGAYHNQFWIEDVNTRAFMARGVFGQLIYVNQIYKMVAVKLSSWPEFTSVSRLKDTLSALHAVGKFLNKTC